MESPRLVIFMLVFSSLFAPFSFAFSSLAWSYEGFEDTGLDSESLIASGLTLGASEYHNITFGGGWEHYDLNGTRFRIAWIDTVTDYFKINAQTNVLDRFLNTWFFPDPCVIERTDTTGFVLNYAGAVTHTDLLLYFNEDFNWTRFRTREFAMNLFFSPDNDTITMSDQIDSGIMKVTLAKNFSQDFEFTFEGFINWYWGIVSGANSYGLPTIFNWIIRIITMIQIICAIWVTKDLIRV